MKQTLAICIAFFCSQINAQNIQLSDISATKQQAVVMPVNVDSTDSKDKKFTEESLLKLRLSISAQNLFSYKYSADTAGFFNLPAQENAYIQLFSFYVSANSFGKARVKVTSPNMLEIYVNNKLVSSKTTAEESRDKAKSATADFSPYPQTCRVVVKLLHTNDDITSFKIDIEDILHGTIIKNPSDDTKDNLPTQRLSVSENPHRKTVLDDVIKGKRISNIALSPAGKYALIYYSNNYGIRTSYSTELFYIKNGHRIIIDTDNQKRQLSWMPISDLLYYISREIGRAHV